ncbi:MAG: hypothetical protein H0W49_08830 [Nitrospirales bacterium]|nr:hypothetical protein [Nitrospirales bacterium]
MKIEDSIIVYRRHEELFRFWRQLDNRLRFMDDIEHIEIFSPTRSRWIMAVPIMENVPGPSRVEWEAEIINEKEHEGIGWLTMDHTPMSIMQDRFNSNLLLMKMRPKSGALSNIAL